MDQAPDLVRRATLHDLPAIADVLSAAFAPFRASYTPACYAATTPGVDRLVARLDEGPVWVAMAGGRIVGTVAAVARGPDLYVRSMAVLPEARGRDLGSVLMSTVEAFARAGPYTRMTLSTTPFLAAALALYARLGYLPDPTGPTDLLGTALRSFAKEL